MTFRASALLFSAILVTQPARADFGANWQSLTSTVKVKVAEWMAYWQGAPAPVVQVPPPAGAPAGHVANGQSPVNPSAPTVGAGTGSSAPTVGAGTTAALPAAPVATKAPSADLKSAAERISRLREQVRTHELTRVAAPARPGTSKLPKSVSGVPLVDFKQLHVTKAIPRLDIGTEEKISAEDFKMDGVQFAAVNLADERPLGSVPPLTDVELKGALAKVEPAYGARSLQGNMRTVGQPIDPTLVRKVAWTMKPMTEVKPLPYRPLDEELLKMVAALILFDRGGHCPMVMGLFHNLAKAEKTRLEAEYHLGACAAELKMNQAAFETLSRVVASEDKEFAPLALDVMVKGLPLIYEENFFQLMKNVKSYKTLVGEKSRDVVAYRMAKGAFKAKDYRAAATWGARVSEGTEYQNDAKFLVAMTSYSLGDKKAAKKKLEELSAVLDAKLSPDKNLKALTAVNLARMDFADKKFDQALAQYMRVPKDHPLWVEALIEQGWAQIATEDFSGAIGNMYSLHSPYFKAVYQPESFAVRTIGYLNICQYGDAYRTLSELEKEYRDFQAKTAQYLGAKGSPAAIYASTKSYIRGKSTESVDGVPYQVWREMARRKDFLNLQIALNDKGDEVHRYDGVNERIKAQKAEIRARADGAKKHFDEWRAKLSAIAKDKRLEPNRQSYEVALQRERDNVIGARFQLAMLEQSREGFLDFRGKAQTNLSQETTNLELKAGSCLLARAKTMSGEMARVLENNEFLRYEVFSGSGENIRYQVAGGKVGNVNRIPASIKPSKSLNWNFDGEFWADEIGSYRSALQNVCPTNPTAQAKLNIEHDED